MFSWELKEKITFKFVIRVSQRSWSLTSNFICVVNTDTNLQKVLKEMEYGK